jgi:hypothetical protein
MKTFLQPRQRSRYSDWLRAGRQRSRSSSPGRVKNCHFSTSSTPALGPTQLPIQRAPGAVSSGVERSGSEAGLSPPTSAEVKETWVYTSTLPPPPCLLGVVLSELSAETTLPLCPSQLYKGKISVCCVSKSELASRRRAGRRFPLDSRCDVGKYMEA